MLTEFDFKVETLWSTFHFIGSGSLWSSRLVIFHLMRDVNTKPKPEGDLPLNPIRTRWAKIPEELIGKQQYE